MTRLSIASTLMIALLLATLPGGVRAQTALTPADAAEFMGVWTIMLDTPQGSFEQEMNVKDEGGKVVAVITNQMQPEAQKITDISKEGKDLVLKFSGDFQGNPFDAKVVVTPNGGDKVSVSFDINGGQFSMTGAGTKKK